MFGFVCCLSVGYVGCVDCGGTRPSARRTIHGVNFGTFLSCFINQEQISCAAAVVSQHTCQNPAVSTRRNCDVVVAVGAPLLLLLTLTWGSNSGAFFATIHRSKDVSSRVSSRNPFPERKRGTKSRIGHIHWRKKKRFVVVFVVFCCFFLYNGYTKKYMLRLQHSRKKKKSDMQIDYCNPWFVHVSPMRIFVAGVFAPEEKRREGCVPCRSIGTVYYALL